MKLNKYFIKFDKINSSIMRKLFFNSSLGVALFAGLLVACNPSGNNSESSDDANVEDVQASDIQVNPIDHSKEFPGAELLIESITGEKISDSEAKITVKYTVNNFELTSMTEHDHANHLANSHDGQHIHFILDNKPYDALYAPEHEVTVPLNSDHYLLSFLSRSYHESIKTPGAHKLIKFHVDENGQIQEQELPDEPGLFYSRPKGEYVGADTENILLDFFLVNTTIGADGNKVLAEVNGEEFTLDSWQPYEITGAPFGDLKVKLTLVDAEGNQVVGDNTSIERDVKLLED